jgi:hypothetical protein
MSDPTGPVTLGDLIHANKLLWVYCRDCCHERDMDPKRSSLSNTNAATAACKCAGDGCLIAS